MHRGARSPPIGGAGTSDPSLESMKHPGECQRAFLVLPDGKGKRLSGSGKFIYPWGGNPWEFFKMNDVKRLNSPNRNIYRFVTHRVHQTGALRSHPYGPESLYHDSAAEVRCGGTVQGEGGPCCRGEEGENWTAGTASPGMRHRHLSEEGPRFVDRGGAVWPKSDLSCRRSGRRSWSCR